MVLLTNKASSGELTHTQEQLLIRHHGVSIVKLEWHQLKLGIDTFYYSMKPAAREMCAPIQHQIVTLARLDEEGEKIYSLLDYGYGNSAGGCLDINCHHTLTPYVVGINYKPDLPKTSPSQSDTRGSNQER